MSAQAIKAFLSRRISMRTTIILLIVLLSQVNAWSLPDQLQVIADEAALRELPSPQSRVLLTVRKGTRLELTEKTGEWYEVFTPDGTQKAFVHAGLVRPLTAERSVSQPTISLSDEKPEKQVQGRVRVKVDRANIRELPGTESRVLRTVGRGSELSFTARSGNWYEVILPDGATGFISAGIVEILAAARAAPRRIEQTRAVQAETVEKEPEKRIVTKTVADKKSKIQKPPRSKTKRKPPGWKKLYLAGFYFMGMQEEEARSALKTTLYFEEAGFATLYRIERSSSFSAALGYHFSPALALEIGADISSRSIKALNSFSIPHPLWVNEPRTGENETSGNLQENGIYLNLVYVLRLAPLQVRLSAGPCYIMAKAGIIGDFSISEPAYPFSTINLSPQGVENSQNVFGFNAAAALGFSFSDSFALLIEARYINGKAAFETGTEYPGPEISLGGLKIGAGLKISF